MANFLITGGAGFIGSHLAETLVKKGERVTVIDNLATGKRENLLPASQGPGELIFLEEDIRDLDACQRAMEGVDYVLHQAARPSVQRSIENPGLTHDVNLNGGLNVLMAAKDQRVKRVVAASSSSVYGDRENPADPKHEGMDLRPMSPYAAAKVSMEYYATAFYRAYGLETVSLRYFNVFGARQDPESDYAAVIPKFLFSLMEGKQPIIFGDGKQSRDFTHISNVVNANLLACTAEKAPGRAFNVAAGASYDLLYLLEVLGGLLGVKPDPEFAPPRTGDVRYSLADLGLSRRILGYEINTSFEDGLADLVELAQKGEYLAK